MQKETEKELITSFTFSSILNSFPDDKKQDVNDNLSSNQNNQVVEEDKKNENNEQRTMEILVFLSNDIFKTVNELE